VVISHEHHDHNNTSIVKGKPHIIRTSGIHELSSFTAELISVYHDEVHGAQRGKNNIIKLIIDNFTLVHCGDLGHLPSMEILDKIDKPDILFVPVGEIYTLGLDAALKMIRTIHPRLVFPMHYSTSALSFRLGEPDKFTQLFTNVVLHNSNTIEINAELLSSEKTIVMDWKKKG